VILHGILALFASLSLALTLWQWGAARRFPLHQRIEPTHGPSAGGEQGGFAPALTLLKPLKGCDEHTETCLRSWLAQEYAGEIQILFAVGGADDPACAVVKRLLAQFPELDAQLVVCGERLGTNAKVSKLAQLEPRVKHEIIILSDADVQVPPDLLANVVAPLRAETIGLVSCFYRLANPTTLAMGWEAIAINADFWSQVLQSASFRKLDFALGAVMATRRKQLTEIGGFQALADCLADDYQLGHRIAGRGYRIELCPIVVECWSQPMNWRESWRHQLRWARTIRVCQPVPYFFSILSNATLWPLLWLAANPTKLTLVCAVACVLTRMLVAGWLSKRLTRETGRTHDLGLVLLKDIVQSTIWAASFVGNVVEWRGEQYRVNPDGTLRLGRKA